MYLMYVDESGDCGLDKSPTNYFVLSGLTVHESRWKDLLDHILNFRRNMKSVYGLPIRTEIHASEYIRSSPYPGIQKFQRLAILRNYLDELAKIDYISITNVIVNKAGKPPTFDVFEEAWKCLFQRFENTLVFGNYPGRFSNDKGMVFVDNTDGKKLKSLVRKMSVYNPIPSSGILGSASRNIPMVRVVEDPHHKNSTDSYFIQSSDLCAYFLMQKFDPNSYIRRMGGRNYFDRLGNVLNTKASKTNSLGIVTI